MDLSTLLLPLISVSVNSIEPEDKKNQNILGHFFFNVHYNASSSLINITD